MSQDREAKFYMRTVVESRPGCMEWAVYIVGIVIVFGWLMGGLWR